MWWRLRLCLFLNKRHTGDRPLIKTTASTRAVGYKSISFLRTSRIWSKYGLTGISECDERDERSVSSSIIAESNTSDQPEYPVPDFTMYSRIFCSAPGSSSSIIEIESKASLSSSSSSAALSLLLPAVKLVRDSVAVETYSVSPYLDFKRSMLEMVEASMSMKKDTPAARWSFLHEMLHCYLALNHESTHKLIIHAFADLLHNLEIVDALDNGGK